MLHADVAELVDALVSGTSGGNIVGVQVSPSALDFRPRFFLCLYELLAYQPIINFLIITQVILIILCISPFSSLSALFK